MAKFELTTIQAADAAWENSPPDSLADPALYDGMPWRRVFAYGIDVCLIGLVMAVAWLGLSVLSVLSLGLLFPVKLVVLALLPVAYHSYFVGSGGATPGMRALDVEVRTWSGQRPDYFQAFLLTAMFYVTVAMTAWLVLAVALFNDRRRTLHDYLAGTLSVRHSRLSATSQKTA